MLNMLLICLNMLKYFNKIRKKLLWVLPLVLFLCITYSLFQLLFNKKVSSLISILLSNMQKIEKTRSNKWTKRAELTKIIAFHKLVTHHKFVRQHTFLNPKTFFFLSFKKIISKDRQNMNFRVLMIVSGIQIVIQGRV